MAPIDIWDLEISPVTEEHILRHRIIPEQLYAVLDGLYLVTSNRSGRAATHRLIGRDAQDRCITAPIVATEYPHHWRVVTAWYCKKHEGALLRRVE